MQLIFCFATDSKPNVTILYGRNPIVYFSDGRECEIPLIHTEGDRDSIKKDLCRMVDYHFDLLEKETDETCAGG